MSDQVERVAKAMWAHRCTAAMFADVELAPWDEELESLRESVRSEARVAIEAMKPQVSPEFDWLANLLFGPAGPIPPYPHGCRK